MTSYKVCRYFQKGGCWRGSNCKFAHIINTNPYTNYNSNYDSQYYYSQQPSNNSPSDYTTIDYNNINNYFHQNFTKDPTSETLSKKQSLIDDSLPTLVVDIDGTLSDISKRLALAPGSRTDGSRSASDWNVVLNGDEYFRDEVIPPGLAYLQWIARTKKYNILYLSGRRVASMRRTREWLFKLHNYPEGYLIHRPKKTSSYQFKRKELRKLKARYNVCGYMGDRFLDDCICALQAGIRPVLVIQDEWLMVAHIVGGLSSVVQHIIDVHEKLLMEYEKQQSSSVVDVQLLSELKRTEIPDTLLEQLKKSDFYDLSYSDLIPVQFANEMYVESKCNDVNGDEDEFLEYLPPKLKRKCKKNPDYWSDVCSKCELVLKENHIDKNDISQDLVVLDCNSV